MSKTENKPQSIEDNFKALDKIIEKMNKDTCTIEENIKLYEEGAKIILDTKKSIEKVEKKISILGE